ncbi:hypothetical protein AALH12_07070 [Streptococcus ferus]
MKDFGAVFFGLLFLIVLFGFAVAFVIYLMPELFGIYINGLI